MSDVKIILRGEKSHVLDEIGNESAVTDDKTVYGKMRSVGSREFVDAHQLNLRPQCVIEIYTAEYNGAETVIMRGKKLSVYRTYVKGERMELYLAERSGKNIG